MDRLLHPLRPEASEHLRGRTVAVLLKDLDPRRLARGNGVPNCVTCVVEEVQANLVPAFDHIVDDEERRESWRTNTHARQEPCHR